MRTYCFGFARRNTIFSPFFPSFLEARSFQTSRPSSLPLHKLGFLEDAFCFGVVEGLAAELVLAFFLLLEEGSYCCLFSPLPDVCDDLGNHVVPL